MTYESWRISYQSSEEAARSAYVAVTRMHYENEKLRAAIDAMRTAGGSTEFQAAFDVAKAIIASKL